MLVPAGNPIKTGAPIDVIPASAVFCGCAEDAELPSRWDQFRLAEQLHLAEPHRPDQLVDYGADRHQSEREGHGDHGGRDRAAGELESRGSDHRRPQRGTIPYNYGQTYAPKTAVGIIEETHVFTPNIVNQLKYGYARYNGPTFDADQLPAYSATAMGISGLPAGPAQQAFPITSFAGTNAPTQWGGTTPSVTLAENYTLLDNLQWVKGKHTLTFGGQIAWLLYNVVNATGGTTPVTLANAVTETAGITPSSNSKPSYAAPGGTGLSYASFLIGQIDRPSYTQYLQQEFGARFRAMSPYIQDNWKVTSKLTLDLGLRYDFFPTVTEVHNAGSFFNPDLANPVTGVNGALQFTGNGANTCNCSTPVNNYFKNFGPRLGLAYQIDPKTVMRASYGVMFTHGNAVGGSATSLGTLGFAASPSFAASGTLLSTAPLTAARGTPFRLRRPPQE